MLWRALFPPPAPPLWCPAPAGMGDDHMFYSSMGGAATQPRERAPTYEMPAASLAQGAAGNAACEFGLIALQTKGAWRTSPRPSLCLRPAPAPPRSTPCPELRGARWNPPLS